MFFHKYGKYPVYIGILIALFFTAACKLQPFSSTRVKAKPTVYLPLGVKNITEDEIAKKFEEALQKSASGAGASTKNMRLYRYRPDGSTGNDPLRYLAHYPLESFDFNLNSYFGGEPLGENGDASGNKKLLSRKFDTTISIPKINQSNSISVSGADINTKLLEKFNAPPVSPVTVRIPGPGTIPGEYELPFVNIHFEGFDTITFGTGSYLEISVQPNTATYTITEATMDGFWPSVHGEIDGYNVRFPLDDKTISKDIRLIIKIKDINGGPEDVTISRKLVGNIQRATGVNAEPEVTPASGSVDIPLPEDFQRATIGVGEIKLSMEQPADWSGITIAEQTKITQAGAGGLAVNPGSFQPLNTPVSLVGQTLNNQRTLTYEPKLKVKLAHATYTYQENLSVNFNVSIHTFSSITLKNKENFSKPQSDPVPDGMKNWVKTIHFSTVTAKVKLNNGLPEGNAIKIKLSSTCFQMPEQERTFPAGVSESTPVYQGGSNFDLDVEHLDNFDLKPQVLLPGYNEHDNTFTLSDINTDSKIEFSGAVNFDLNWDSMTLKAKNNQTTSFPKTGSMDLSRLTSKLKNASIKLEEIPAYFYAGSNSGLLKNEAMDVKLMAKYVKTGETGATSDDLVSKNGAELKPLPAGTFTSDKKTFTGSIPAAMLAIKKGEAGVKTTFADIMNDYPKDLQLIYTLSMNEITISRAEYEKYKDKNPKIGIDLLLDLPAKFKVESDSRLSLTGFFGVKTDTDVFGRSGPNDNSSFSNDDILNRLQSIQVRINFKNGLSADFGFVLLLKDSAGKALVEESITAAREGRITFTTQKWRDMMKTYPILPELCLKLPVGSYSVKNNFELGAVLSILAETDIDYSL